MIQSLLGFQQMSCVKCTASFLMNQPRSNAHYFAFNPMALKDSAVPLTPFPKTRYRRKNKRHEKVSLYKKSIGFYCHMSII